MGFIVLTQGKVLTFGQSSFICHAFIKEIHMLKSFALPHKVHYRNMFVM